ncbi:ABC transporter ATP-binding protein [Streptomyces sp. NBC_01283]|uniref:ABC transporter ATP-binding protein n=1 Tax=Streptomyces sp. NBC_01283 TaxID=2903812 RepID=UPI00352C7557|nr:ABC transporter ATP-binding protein [Streptomyces sp. NBC_01283]
MAGQQPFRVVAAHEPLWSLRVTGLRKSFARRRVLTGIDVILPGGAIVGIFGENGAGKTTLLRLLCGELSPDGGEVRRRGTMGYCPQAPVLNPCLTVEQHLRFFQAAYGLEGVEGAESLLAQLGFGAYRTSLVGTLSGGTQQKLNLTLALMHEPDLLVLDEPYQGFDWETYLRFWALAERLRERGRTVLIVSHFAPDNSRFDSRYELVDGRLRPLGAAPAPPAPAGDGGLR